MPLAIPSAHLLLLACALATLIAAAPAAQAQGPGGSPTTVGTIKATAGADPNLFARQLALIKERQKGWLTKAAQYTPKLIETPQRPIAVVTMAHAPGAFQGWKIGSTSPLSSVLNREIHIGESFILDFGQHITGRFHFSLRRMGDPVDAPVRLALVFGEVPAEVAEPLDPYPGGLARSWLQDEVVNVDVVPGTVRMPRRYAFRYVKVTLVSTSGSAHVGFSDIGAVSISSANEAKLAPFTAKSQDDALIDTVGRRTLRDCMQTVFEDGPKRDRRLWLGDLRLQALANYTTYRNYDLVKRSLYILAGTATPVGLVSTCAYELPEPVHGGSAILDYTALFAPAVLEYLQASGDRHTAEDLWPLVLKQLDFTLETVGTDGLYTPPAGWWSFIDWQPDLDRQAAEHATILYGAKATRNLAGLLGHSSEVAFLDKAIPAMESAARSHLWDETRGVFVSGPSRQVSWASQAWMAIAGVPTREQAHRSMQYVMRTDDAVKPVTPYLHHYIVEALYAAGMADEASRLLHSYWGGMVKLGADTFWEVYVPGNDKLSPYNSHLVNSYCHAWSCTATYFLRKHTSLIPSP